MFGERARNSRAPSLPGQSTSTRSGLRRRLPTSSRSGRHRAAVDGTTFPGECSRIGEIATLRVHEGAAEVEVGLILVVCRAAQLDVSRRRRSAHGERSFVVEVDVARLAAATSAAVYVAAASRVASPYLTPHGCGDCPGSLFSLRSGCIGRGHCGGTVGAFRVRRRGRPRSIGAFFFRRRRRFRSIGRACLARECPDEQHVDRTTYDRGCVATGRRAAEQILKRPELVVRGFVYGDLDLVTTRAERND